MELPTVIDCGKIPEQGLHVEGALPPQSFSRIGPEFKISTPVTAQITIKTGATDKIHLAGGLCAELTSRCQRCLEGMQILIKSEFDFELIEVESTDSTDGERPEKENIALKEGRLYLTEMLEDEILLSCPMIPSHGKNETCIHNLTKTSPPDDIRQRPFANLNTIIKSNKK